MRMLLWKDYRLNRLLFVMGLTLLVGPYLVVLLWHAYSDEVPPGIFQESRFWAGFLLMSSTPSLAFSQLTVAFLAANVVACERTDRSAEFLGYLPPSRARILSSKAILVWSTALLVWGLNILAVALAPVISAAGKQEFVATWFSLSSFYVTTVATGLLLLGAAWFASCISSSPAFSAGLGIAAPFLVISCFQIINLSFAWPGLENVQDWYTRSCLILGPLCFAAGTVYYLRRVEP
jgi:ABC-type transport system involved in multi-copper enzyme maturation permease subunit